MMSGPYPTIETLKSFFADVLRHYNTSNFSRLTLDGQMSWVYRPQWGDRKPTQVARSVLSYTRARIPIQVPLSGDDITTVVKALVGGDWARAPPNTYGHLWEKRGWCEEMFPYKRNAGAITKANVYLHDVMADLRAFPEVQVAEIKSELLRLRVFKRVTNDQAVAFVMYAVALNRAALPGARWAASMLASADLAKEFSNYMKAVGGNSTTIGAMLVEANTLQGRGVNPIDAKAEARERCDQKWVDSKVADFSPGELRQAIRRILALELKRDNGSYHLDFPTMQDHWDARWQWAVNGAHNPLIDRLRKVPPPVVEGAKRLHRRAALETYEEDPRNDWDGTTYVSTSPKEEHGKTRAIYACDTVNYLGFQHLMATVESNWRGVRVVLDPGKGGLLGMADRVAACRVRSGVSMMLDYDDFNSHHTTQAMQMLIQETCEMTGYPPELTDRLVGSFDKMYINSGGSRIGRCLGTLMSGHRCTTFINSVLNMAYLMCLLGSSFLLDTVSLHVGDDVYMGVSSYAQAAWVADRIEGSPLRMNRSKQSVGHVSTEFLRMASDGRCVRGYLARAIASTVSGNWVTAKKLDPMEALTTMVGSARALVNRSGCDSLALLLVAAVKRVVRCPSLDDKLMSRILTGEVGLNDGPQYRSGGMHASVRIRPIYRELRSGSISKLPGFATSQYMTNVATEVEQVTLARAGISVRSQMLVSSYAKSLDYNEMTVEGLEVGPVVTYPAIGSISSKKLLRREPARGVLLRYPLLVLAKGQLTKSQVLDAIEAVGGNRWAKDWEVEAWGDASHGCIIMGALPYSDAAALGKRTGASVIYPHIPCYV